MKALVLAAGRGQRLGDRPEMGTYPDEGNKCMLRLFGKPLVQYSLENAVRAGVDEIVVVVGYRAEAIINEFGIETSGHPHPLRDPERTREGLVHAIECARDQIGENDFMLFLADEILWHPQHEEMVRKFNDEELFVHLRRGGGERGGRRSRRPTPLIEDDRDRRVYRLIEKPRKPPNAVRGTGNVIFRAGHLRLHRPHAHQPEPRREGAAGPDPVRHRRRAPWSRPSTSATATSTSTRQRTSGSRKPRTPGASATRTRRTRSGREPDPVQSRFLAVIPAYNEAATIEELVLRASRHADVCVVDDASTDGTAETSSRRRARRTASGTSRTPTSPAASWTGSALPSPRGTPSASRWTPG